MPINHQKRYFPATLNPNFIHKNLQVNIFFVYLQPLTSSGTRQASVSNSRSPQRAARDAHAECPGGGDIYMIRRLLYALFLTY